jgi:hypothetical protein
LPTEVAQEVIDALVAAKKHEITILSRNVRIGPGDCVLSAIMLLTHLGRLPRGIEHRESRRVL